MNDVASPTADAGRDGPWRLDEARRAALRVIERLGREDDAIRLSVVGTVRRMAPLHDRVELLATAFDAGRLLDALEGLPIVAAGLERGRAHAVVQLDDDVPVRLDVTTEAGFAAALIERTGPAAHAAALRRAGLDLDAAEGADEVRLYADAGLAFVPPERREAPGLEVAPDLVSMADVQGVIGLRGADREGTEALVQRAAEEGYGWALLDDPDVGAAMQPYLPEGFRVVVGGLVSVDADGPLETSRLPLDAYDVVIAEVRHATTARILRVLEDPQVDALAFPFDAVLPERAEPDVDRNAVLDACAARRVAVAWSGDPRRLTLGLAWHEAARQRGLRGIPLADAREPSGIDRAILAVGQARRGGWRRDEILTTLDVDAFLAWARDRRE